MGLNKVHKFDIIWIYLQLFYGVAHLIMLKSFPDDGFINFLCSLGSSRYV